MRPEFTLPFLLLAVAAAAPLASAICVPRHSKQLLTQSPIDTIIKPIGAAVPKPALVPKPVPVAAPTPKPAYVPKPIPVAAPIPKSAFVPKPTSVAAPTPKAAYVPNPVPVAAPTPKAADVPKSSMVVMPIPKAATPRPVFSPSTLLPHTVSIPELIASKPVAAVLSPIIKNLCAKTDYHDLCQSSIAKLPSLPSGPPDAAGVLKLAMNAVREKIVEAKNAATDIIADPKTPKLALGPLNDCLESYDDMEYSLDEAVKAMASGDKDTMGTMLDTVRTDVDTCDEGFEEREELTPLLSVHEAVLAKLSSNCLAIATSGGLR